MEEMEYYTFVVNDTLTQLAHALGIYVAALSAYWIFVS